MTVTTNEPSPTVVESEPAPTTSRRVRQPTTSDDFLAVSSPDSSAEHSPPVRGRLLAASGPLQTTPGRLRAASIAVLAVTALAMTFAWSVLRERHDGAVQARDEAVLLAGAARAIDSSIVDADAASTAAFLTVTGEDPAQRRRYDDALTRATEQLVAAAALAGPDATDTIGELNTQLNRYNAGIERARSERLDHGGNGFELLASASALRAESISPLSDTLQTDARRQLQLATDRATSEWWRLVGAITVAAVTALGFAAFLAVVSRRIINLPVGLAFAALVALLVGVLATGRHQGNLLLSDGPAAQTTIDDVTDVRVLAVELNTARNANILAGFVPGPIDDIAKELADTAITRDIVTAARRGEPQFGGRLSELVKAGRTDDERALAAETLVRWQRFVDVVAGMPSGPVDDQARRAAFEANRAFIGFNVGLDSFLTAVESRHGATLAAASTTGGRLPLLPITVGLIAVALFLVGAQQRIDDYR